MNTFLALIAILAAATAGNLNRHFPRRYELKEEDPNLKFFFWEDEKGKLHIEDLRNSKVTVKTGIEDITLYLHTKENRGTPEVISATDFGTLINSKYFNPNRRIVFITHGWRNDENSLVNVLLTDAFLSSHDVNVFVTGWGNIAHKKYITAKNAVPVIGGVVGNFINQLISHFGVSSKTIALIGHSLGAHISGCAGAVVSPKVDHIIGLDPALPLFSLKNTHERLDKTDAEFVQIIHTNGGRLGFASSIGHSDYFPNGGTRQPGCGLDIGGSCAHSRSYIYLAESIQSSAFESWACDSHHNFESGFCSGNQKSFLGGYHIDKNASGDYYLNTNKEEPFAIS